MPPQECDPTTLTDVEYAETVRFQRQWIDSQPRDPVGNAALKAQSEAIFELGDVEPPPTRPRFGPCTCQNYSGVTDYKARGLTPEVIGTYAASFPAQPDKMSRENPGVPLIVSTKITGSTRDAIRGRLLMVDGYRVRGGGVVYWANWREQDRHAIKNGLNLDAAVEEAALTHEVAVEDVPSMVPHLWSNPTGYAAEDRWDTYVEPFLPYVAGVAVAGFDSRTSPASWRFVASRCRDLGLGFGNFEVGEPAGPVRSDGKVPASTTQHVEIAKMLDTLEAIHADIVPVSMVAYWPSLDFEATPGVHLDYRMTPQSWDVWEDHDRR